MDQIKTKISFTTLDSTIGKWLPDINKEPRTENDPTTFGVARKQLSEMSVDTNFASYQRINPILQYSM